MQDNQKYKWTIKDKLEIAEAVFTIVVSIMAIWGTIIAWEKGFWHKLSHVVNHLHYEMMLDKDTQLIDEKAADVVEKIKEVL